MLSRDDVRGVLLTRDGKIVEFHNPGVKEVLMRYVNDNDSIRPLMLNHIYYIDQFFGVFNGKRYMANLILHKVAFLVYSLTKKFLLP